MRFKKFSIEGRRWVAGITFRGKFIICIAYGDNVPVAIKLLNKSFGSIWARPSKLLN